MASLRDLVIGWLLGILSPVASDLIKLQRRKIEFMRSAIGELRELQVRMALVAERLYNHVYLVDRDFMKQVLGILEKYDGPEKEPELVEALRKSLARPDAELKAAYMALRRPGGGLRLSRYTLPLLGSDLQVLSSCPVDFQRRLLQIKTHLDYFNDEVGFALDMFDKTFDSSITGNNRKAVEENLDTSHRNLAKRARGIVDLIGDFEGRYGSLGPTN